MTRQAEAQNQEGILACSIARAKAAANPNPKNLDPDQCLDADAEASTNPQPQHQISDTLTSLPPRTVRNRGYWGATLNKNDIHEHDQKARNPPKPAKVKVRERKRGWGSTSRGARAWGLLAPARPFN